MQGVESPKLHPQEELYITISKDIDFKDET
jgi:hypothetical protein